MPRLLLSIVVLGCLLLSGCASLMSSAQRSLSARLEAGVLNNEDPATVAAGLPAYLLLVDGLIDGSPGDADLLCTGAQLYGAYAGNLIEAGPRAQKLANKARDYGRRALCSAEPQLCGLEKLDFDALTARLQGTGAAELPRLGCMGQAWATAIQANAEDWEAIAEIPKVRAVFERIAAVDPAYDDGTAELYLGVLNTLLPEAYGGRPEQGKAHFERALELSQGRNLMVHVLYAERYARLVFDRDLHDRLLKQALDAPVGAPRLTLINTLAQQRAQQLAASADDYF